MIYAVIYIFATAIAIVLDHLIGIHMPDMLMVLLTTLYTILFFNLISFKSIPRVYRKLMKSKKIYAATLVVVTIMWLGSFYAPIYFSPAIHIFTFMCYTSLFGSFLLFIKNGEGMHLLKAILIFSLLNLFYFHYYLHHEIKNFLTMLSITSITGISGYLYMNISNHLSELNFKATEILASRYWLLLIIPLSVVIKNHEYTAINFKTLGETLILSIILLIIPTFLIQKSIEKIGANLTAVMIGLTPMVTFIFEKIMIGTEMNLLGYFSTALALVIIIPYALRFLKINVYLQTNPTLKNHS